MKAKAVTPALWLWLLMPSIAHASSFALVLYPFGAVTAILITGVLLSRGKRLAIRIAAAVSAILTAVCVSFLPTEFYSSSQFQYFESWLGEWVFFILGLVPSALVAFLVLMLATQSPRRSDA